MRVCDAMDYTQRNVQKNGGSQNVADMDKIYCHCVYVLCVYLCGFLTFSVL